MSNAYKKEIKDIFKELGTSECGLNNNDVIRLTKIYGKNILKEKNKKTKLSIFLSQFKNVMVILLIIVGILSLIYSIINKSGYLEPIVILSTSLINCFMGFLQESKAEDALSKLKKDDELYYKVFYWYKENIGKSINKPKYF